jgi:hypothetical protein
MQMTNNASILYRINLNMYELDMEDNGKKMRYFLEISPENAEILDFMYIKYSKFYSGGGFPASIDGGDFRIEEGKRLEYLHIIHNDMKITIIGSKLRLVQEIPNPDKCFPYRCS